MELIKKLQQIDLCKREAEVYIALLQKREFTAPELAKITTVTRTKIYEILQNLVRKGMCNEYNKNGHKLYRAVKPNVIIQSVISNLELEIEQQKKATKEKERKAEIERKKKAAIEQKKVAVVEQKKIVAMSLENELTALYEKKQHNLEPLDYIEVLTDVGQIKDRWLTIQTNTKKELLTFVKPPYTQLPEDNIEVETERLNHQISYRSLYEYGSLDSSKEINNLIKSVEIFQKKGEDARMVRELPMKLVISDETITMLPLVDMVSLKPSLTVLIINHQNFAKAQKEIFNSYWIKAISVEKLKKSIIDN
jgi:HTH-type transcriptional regulator, sugar sensing transcriptional regulator